MSETTEPQDPQKFPEGQEPEANMPPPAGMTAEAPPPEEPLSHSDKLIGVLTEPSPTFENVRAAGSRVSDWLIPAILMMIVIGAGTLVRFSNPEFAAQIQQAQESQIQKQLESGDLTQEQADQAHQQLESMRGFFGILGAVTGAIGYFVFFFVIALFYWLIVRFLLRGDPTYTLVLSAVGLVMYINIVDQLVSLLLMYLTGKPIANLSPVLFMDVSLTSMSFVAKVAMLLNPIAIWATWVLGIGLEKVGNISRTKGLIAAFGLYIIFTLLTLSMSMGT